MSPLSSEHDSWFCAFCSLITKSCLICVEMILWFVYKIRIIFLAGGIMFEFRLKWFNQEREEEHLVISPPPPYVFWLSHWLWKPYLSGIFNLWVLPTLSKLLRWAISDRPRSFTDVYEKDYKFVKEFSEGEIYVVCCKSSALFHVRWLYAFLYVQREEFGYSLWGQKVSLLMSLCFEGLSDIQAVVTPTIDGLNGKQVCVCMCGCKTITCSTPPMRN